MSVLNRTSAAVGLIGSFALVLGVHAGEKSVWKDTMVIEDRGGIAITDFIEKRTDASQPAAKNAWYRARDGHLAHDLYPVETPNMSLGPITQAEARGLRSELLQFPLFVVGYDPVSMSWLRRNLETLVRVNAMGMVINVDSPAQMQSLFELTQNRLILQPSSGVTLPDALGLVHYPAYIHPQTGVMR